MLSESQCVKLEAVLTEDVEPRKVAAYLCLHMGLTVAEASAIRLSDIDLLGGTLTLRNALTRAKKGGGSKSSFDLAPLDRPRTLPMSPQVIRLLERHTKLYQDAGCFLVSGGQSVPGAHLLQNLLVSVNTKYKIADSLTALHLRNAFIRRCLEDGVDLYTVGEYVGMKQLSELQKRFGQYLKTRFDAIAQLNPTQPRAIPAATSGKRMNLLILGAGSQGQVVKEIAEALGVFHKIAFLDDDPHNELAIDSCENFKKYVDLYPIALPSFGDCQLRARWIEWLEEAGFILPTLIHPMATVSPSGAVDAGTIVEAKVIIGAGARIAKGCIISSGAIVDLNARVGEYCHVNCAAAVKKDACVAAFTRVESGEVFQSS